MNSMNPDRDTSALKGVAKVRSAGTIKRLQMYKNFKAKRDKRGAVIKAAPYQGYVDSGTRARVQPARGWFSNTKVISQSALQKFQESMGAVAKDPYKVVMNPTKLPITLLQAKAKSEAYKADDDGARVVDRPDTEPAQREWIFE